MRAWIFRTVIGLSLFLTSITHSIGKPPADLDPEGSLPEAATSLVHAALQAELMGDAARRDALLRTALETDPECAPARWHLGYVKWDDKWLSPTEVANRLSSDPNLAEYHQKRESLVGTPQGELLLARWCGTHKLTDQARFHWLSLLRFQPQHEEALRSLDMQWYRGMLLSRDEIAQQKRRDFQAAKNPFNVSTTRKRQWERTIAKWERTASAGNETLPAMMEADLAADGDDHLVPFVNFLLGQCSRKPKDAEAFRLVSLNWVKVLAKDASSAKYLVMQAIGHPSADVRAAAADELKNYRKEDYVPLLLTCARFPIEVSFSMLTSAGYSSAHFTMDIEGLDADLQLDHSASRKTAIRDEARMLEPVQDGVLYGGTNAAEVAMYSALWTRAALSVAAQLPQQIARYNAISDQVNRRVIDALRRATGENFEDHPRTWQAWWKEYLCGEYEIVPGQGGQAGSGQTGLGYQGSGNQTSGGQQTLRPIVYVSSGSQQVVQQYGQLSSDHACSCFQEGTLVWTDTGPRPIEQIRPGDRVLSQHPTSGELAYKVVYEVTKTDPAPMMALMVGGEKIVSTLGHPFWEVGKGWTMSKHLHEGSVLHTVNGPVVVKAVQELPAAKEWYAFSYNLVVDDFHTYFVGKNGTLVHHLTYLSILDEGSANVPGY